MCFCDLCAILTCLGMTAPKAHEKRDSVTSLSRMECTHRIVLSYTSSCVCRRLCAIQARLCGTSRCIDAPKVKAFIANVHLTFYGFVSVFELVMMGPEGKGWMSAGCLSFWMP